jgi:hypothetical protein
MAITVDPSEPFHVLLGGQVTPVSLEVLDALYQDDTIEESTLIWQQGLGEWLRLDAVLAELEKQEPPAPQQREVEPDSYYVNFGDSDVRLLSLDQLDKFYDLEVIDDSTLVWQPGFAEWIPLAVLIGEPDAPPVSIHPSLGPQHATSRPPAAAPAFSAPPPAGFGPGASRPPAATAPMFSAPPPASLRPATPAPASVRPVASAPASVRPAASAPASVRPVAPSARPPQSLPAPSMPSAASSRPAPLSSAPYTSAPYSSAPSAPYSLVPNSLREPGAVVLSTLPQPQKASPWFGRGLMAAMLFAGLLVVQRNGVMMQLAEGAGQGSSWRSVEASMGGTSLDTPQGLSAWLADLSTRHGLGSLTPTEPVAAEPSNASKDEPEASAAFKITPLPPPAPASELKPPATTSSLPAADPKSMDIAEKMRAKLSGEAERPVAQTRSVSRPSSSSKSSAKKKKSGGADAYDPMNGTL